MDETKDELLADRARIAEQIAALKKQIVDLRAAGGADMEASIEDARMHLLPLLTAQYTIAVKLSAMH